MTPEQNAEFFNNLEIPKELPVPPFDWVIQSEIALIENGCDWEDFVIKTLKMLCRSSLVNLDWELKRQLLPILNEFIYWYKTDDDDKEFFILPDENDPKEEFPDGLE